MGGGGEVDVVQLARHVKEMRKHFKAHTNLGKTILKVLYTVSLDTRYSEFR